MLILTRKCGQELLIGEDIIVRVLGINKFGIEIGIDAPKSLIIQRAEKRKELKGYGYEGIRK